MPDSSESTVNLPASAPKRRPLRLLSVISIAFSSSIFACAGCCFLTSFLLRSQELPGPAGAERVAAGITEWTLPRDFSGTSGILINNMMLRLDIAKFDQKKGRGTLSLAQLQSKLLPVPDQAARTLELVQQNVLELRKIAIEERESRTLTIRNLPATFELVRGEDRASTTKYRQIIGSFRGKVDDVVLILQYEDGFLTDQEVDDFLKSIK